MKKSDDAFCPGCEWSGDATGITLCPVCGTNLSMIDAFDEGALPNRRDDKYPTDVLAHVEENDESLE